MLNQLRLRELDGRWRDVAAVAIQSIVNGDSGLRFCDPAAQRFGNIERRPDMISWIQPLALTCGSKLSTSEPAATTMAMIATWLSVRSMPNN